MEEQEKHFRKLLQDVAEIVHPELLRRLEKMEQKQVETTERLDKAAAAFRELRDKVNNSKERN